jgi:hypothetical protein
MLQSSSKECKLANSNRPTRRSDVSYNVRVYTFSKRLSKTSGKKMGIGRQAGRHNNGSDFPRKLSNTRLPNDVAAKRSFSLKSFVTK